MSTLSTGSTFTQSLPAMLLQALASLAPRAVLVCTRVSSAQDDQAPQALTLEHSAIHPIDRPLGRTITCESGALWLTFDNTPCDVVLEAGESHRCSAANRLLIQALQGSRVRVQ
jgi:hypothetical protein